MSKKWKRFLLWLSVLVIILGFCGLFSYVIWPWLGKISDEYQTKKEHTLNLLNETWNQAYSLVSVDYFADSDYPYYYIRWQKDNVICNSYIQEKQVSYWSGNPHSTKVTSLCDKTLPMPTIRFNMLWNDQQDNCGKLDKIISLSPEEVVKDLCTEATLLLNDPSLVVIHSSK